MTNKLLIILIFCFIFYWLRYFILSSSDLQYLLFINMTVRSKKWKLWNTLLDVESLKGKMELFWPKKLSHFKLSNQFDYNILQLLEIPGQILVPPVTWFFRPKWLHFFFRWSLVVWERYRAPAVLVRGVCVLC